MLCEILYADDLILISVVIERLNYKFINWKDAIESKALKE